MPDLSILNILITMVIVILLLSLVVQSLQTLTKKLLKLKSRSILNSLEDLFETITKNPTAAAGPGATMRTPKELVEDVTTRLKEMGRKSLFGNPMLDSLAKGDLLKILTRVKAEDLLPGTVDNFQHVLIGIHQLKAELGHIDTTLLQGEASAKFAAMKGSIMPLIHDLEALASGGNIDPAVFLGDLYRLRQIKAAEVLNILGQIQQTVSLDLAAAQKASDEANQAIADAQESQKADQIALATKRGEEASVRLGAAKSVDTGLKNIADQIAALSTAFDAAFAPLFARLEQVEVWYDTVMQGFEERYSRHMKSVGLVISIAVVIALNANFFSIYRAIRADPVKTALIVQQGASILETAKKESESLRAVAPAQTGGAAVVPPASPAPAERPVTVADVEVEAKKVDTFVRTYESFGLEPLSREQIRNAFEGKYGWRLSETFLGWAIMVMLLSAGAPFWQDALESLFGLKNMLRQKSDTQNIEGQKGGQPKP